MERNGDMPELDITLKVNGRTLKWRVQPGDTLLEALHAHHLKGAKLICGTGDCCGCGVILNGNSINSCCMLAARPTAVTCSPSRACYRKESFIQYRRPLLRKEPPSAGIAPLA